jgi:replicative DNA helicase
VSYNTYLPQPHSSEAEMAVLGAMLLDPDRVEDCVESLKKEDFYHPSYALVFEAINTLHNNNKPIDLVTLTEQLQTMKALEDVGGVTGLTDLASSVPAVLNTPYYMDLIKEKSLLRKLIKLGRYLEEVGYEGNGAEEAIDKAEREVFSFATEGNPQGLQKAKDFIYDYYNQLEARSKSDSPLTGVSTGFSILDKMTAGLQKSDLIIVAGRPSMGKTAFAINLAENVCDLGGKVAVFSLEMSKEQLLERMASSQSKVSGEALRIGQLTDKDWNEVRQALGRIKNWDLEIDDCSSTTVNQIRSKVRKSHAQKPVDLVIIDYLQLINPPDGKASFNKADQVGEISKALKQLARELNCPIVVLSQLSRAVESREDKRPMMSDLRDSGAIEQDADLVLFLYRDDYYNHESPKKGIAEVIIGKQRKGAVGNVELTFLRNITKFMDLHKKK